MSISLKKISLVILFILLIPALSRAWFWSKRNLNFENKNIVVWENGVGYLTTTNSKIVSDFLKEKNINVGDSDEIFPDIDSKIFPEMEIRIRHTAKFEIEVDGREISSESNSKNILGALLENNITLSRLDKVSPEPLAPLEDGGTIVVTRINEEEKIIQEEIDFKTTTKTDSDLGWREEKISQKGEEGIMEVKYKITYKNGKEISRVALEKNIIKEPVTEIIIKGSYVKFGDSHTGAGTWYSQPSGIQNAYPSLTGYYLANPWLAKGSYVKVTNKANGKSIIAIVNDRGPFGEGRIVDLDKKAFAAIASIGAGIINVKVEEILN